MEISMENPVTIQDPLVIQDQNISDHEEPLESDMGEMDYFKVGTYYVTEDVLICLCLQYKDIQKRY